MKKIFLSASVPKLDRPEQYYNTADVIAIRDAVKALATVVIPKAELIWGGHPAITPLIREILERMNTNVQHHVTIYQSGFFEGHFPKDNKAFEHIIITEPKADKPKSLDEMRARMIGDNDFAAGIFIGGMEGVEEEYGLFKQYHPATPALAIASTGAAAGIVYKKELEDGSNPDTRLKDDYAYMALFKDLLRDVISSSGGA